MSFTIWIPKKLAAISFPIHFLACCWKKLADEPSALHFLRVHLAHLRLRDFRMLAPETIYGNFKA
jgi:hypothetical protein